jgi:hypothetical protein
MRTTGTPLVKAAKAFPSTGHDMMMLLLDGYLSFIAGKGSGIRIPHISSVNQTEP